MADTGLGSADGTAFPKPEPETAHDCAGGIPNHLPGSVAVANNETGRVQTAGRRLRDRTSIQLQPYTLEREVYRRAVKVGRKE